MKKSLCGLLLTLFIFLLAISAGAEQNIEPKINSAKITLGENITVYYTVTLPEQMKDAVMVFTAGSKMATVEGVPTATANRYTFAFEGLTPQMMGDNIAVDVIYTHPTSGDLKVASKAEYSVLQYCESMLAKAKANTLGLSAQKNAALITLLADTLEYGAAAQAFMNYNVDRLVNAGITDQSEFVPLGIEYKAGSPSTTTAADGTCLRSASAVLDNTIYLKFKLATSDIDRVSLVIDGVVYSGDDFTATGEVWNNLSCYELITPAIMATGLDHIYDLSLRVDGVECQTYAYGFVSYVYAKQNDANATVANMVRATRSYGLSALAYKSNDPSNGTPPNVEKHTVTINPANSDPISTQLVAHGGKAEAPAIPKRLGYVFLGWYYVDGTTEELWSFTGHTVTKDITLIAKWDYATYELPIINIDTNNAAINSKIDYVNMTFTLENCDSELDEVSGKIRLRGNSTSRYAKKPYRIKFDKKQSLFGLDSAKSWVLLADYLDPSALHNYTAFSLASKMDALSFTPTGYKVNIYLNGEYQGLYTLCEQVQEDKGRIDIKMDEITEDMVDLKDYNFFICMDKSVLEDVESVLDETYFYIEEYQRYFELKYPEKGDFATEEQFNSFFTQLKTYTKTVLDAFYNNDLETIYAETNVNSLIDFLLVDLIMGEYDHTYKSFNMYFTNTSDDPEENGKLNFGPIWDYDWSLNTPWTSKPNEFYEIDLSVKYTNYYYKAVKNIPELNALLQRRYNLYAKDALATYIENFDALHESISESLALNHELWYSSYEYDITQKNVAFLKEYLMARKEQFDQMWSAD